VGDPACDLVLAWTLLPERTRPVFRDAVGLDDATWARARGWALWKALLDLEAAVGSDPERVAVERRVIEAVIGEHR
ncbi:MAG: aminoglycoside phosphotransferase, partial [Phycicoccus sp.]